MPINKDGTNITAVRYTPIGDTEKVITQVIYVDTAGTQTAVFGAQVSSPTILANPIRSYNQVTISAQNTYDIGVIIYMTVNGVTKSAVASAYQTTGDIVAFNFTGLTSNITYSVSAYSTAAEHANSAPTTDSVTTTTVYTTMPSFVGTPTSTWNSISWRLKNDDNATSIVKTRLYANDQNTPVGDELTVSLAPGGEYTFSKTGLSYSTNYYIKRTAQANDGKLQPTYATTGPYATAAQPTTPSPNVSIISTTSYSVTIRVISGSPDDSATLFYSVVSNNGSPTGYTQHGTTLQGYNADSNGVDITLSTLYVGGSFSPNTNYDVYVKAQISGWKESSSIKYDIQTNPILTAPVITITDVVYNGFKWYSQNQSTVATVQIYSNVNNQSNWPGEYQDTSVAPSANTSIFPITGRYTATAGTAYTVYARAVDPTGAYESSGVGSAAVPVTGNPGFTNLSGSSTTNTLYFRITNNNAYSVNYTWHNSDWSKSVSNVSLGANSSVDIAVTGLSSSTTYTISCYFNSDNRISSGTVSANGTTATPIVYPALPSLSLVTAYPGFVSWFVQSNQANTTLIHTVMKNSSGGDLSEWKYASNTQSATFTHSVSPGTAYYIIARVSATGTTDQELYKRMPETGTYTVPSPGTVSGINSVDAAGSYIINTSWSKSGYVDRSYISYQINGGSWTSETYVTGTTAQHTFSQAYVGQTFRMRIRTYYNGYYSSVYYYGNTVTIKY